MSMLSDAQELIERGENDKARQAINRAKYLIDKNRSREVLSARRGKACPVCKRVLATWYDHAEGCPQR
jgi:hypothetical protein